MGRPKTSRTDRGRRAARAIAAAAWCYLAAAVAAWVLVRVAGEQWWPATLLMFGPRWVLAVPALPVFVACTVARLRWSTVVAAVAGAVVVWPVMGLCVPWHRFANRVPDGRSLRVLTCNAHGIARAAEGRRALDDLIAALRPDVVALQEWGGGPGARAAVPGVPWHALTDGELRLESRYPLRRVGPWFASPGWSGGTAVAYEVALPGGPVTFVNLHLASPHDAIRSAVQLRPDGQAWVELNSSVRGRQAETVGGAAADAGPDVILAGDFNLPPDSAFYRRDLSALADAFAEAGWGFGWTYRNRGTAVRIDHVLTGRAWRARRCWVGPDVGSPHRPVVADLERPTASR